MPLKNRMFFIGIAEIKAGKKMNKNESTCKKWNKPYTMQLIRIFP